MMLKSLFIACCLLLSCIRVSAQYFPPVSGNNWDTVDYKNLGWCSDSVSSLYKFLDENNTKAFILLKGGKIVLEKYFDAFKQDSLWYWASAGKSLTAFLVGIAQEKGFLKISDSTSKYLGKGWTSLTAQQEGKITLLHQLTMTTGLNDSIPTLDCTDPACLRYEADPGIRWSYHNAPYTLLHPVLENATGVSMNILTTQQLKNTTGISGLWVDLGYNNVYVSTARVAARFGLLILNKGKWDGTTLLHDTAYFKQMISPSQQINPSYGYLWWLNGKGKYMLPQSQLVFNKNLVPEAPADMFAALGKDDQKIYVIPSQNMVVVRLGEASGVSLYALSNFDNRLWAKISDLQCVKTSVNLPDHKLKIYPNPVAEDLILEGLNENSHIRIFDQLGKLRYAGIYNGRINVNILEPGIYALVDAESGVLIQRFVKQ